MRADPLEPAPPWPTVNRSHTTTWRPLAASDQAALRPSTPPPTTTNSSSSAAMSGPAVIVEQGGDASHVGSAHRQDPVLPDRREALVVAGQSEVLPPPRLVQEPAQIGGRDLDVVRRRPGVEAVVVEKAAHRLGRRRFDLTHTHRPRHRHLVLLPSRLPPPGGFDQGHRAGADGGPT